jgi:8-oxo-dGTP pyrophosphatase MutT (NUDIX family)
MKNFPVKHNGKEYWISRSVAVAVSLFTHINGQICVLANKRGKGLPNHSGEWNVVSGYIDFDETLNQACVREVKEETGVDISNVQLYRLDIEDDPSRENQVILFRYAGYINNGESLELTNKYSEPDEVDEIKWVPVNELDNYVWTSEKHKEKIKDYSNIISRLLEDD